MIPARLLVHLLALCSLPLTTAAAQQPAPVGYEEGSFELLSTGLAPATLPVLVSARGSFLLPVRATLTPLGVPFTVVLDSTLLHVTRPSGTGVATLRWTAGAPSLEINARVPLDSGDVRVRDGEIYLAAPRFAELLEAKIDVDLATLTIHAEREGGFPAQIRLDVQQKRRNELLRQAREGPPVRVAVPFIPRTGFGVVEWALGGSGTPLGAPSSVESRVGMSLYGGMLKTGTVLVLPHNGESVGTTGGELSYHRVFSDGRLLRQIQLGDVLSGGAQQRPMRGVAITNAPFVLDQRFDNLSFSRPLPPGWEYEVYQGDRLVGFADAATNRSVNVPLQYGSTPLRVRLYGPAGEVVESSVSYVIPVDQLPAGRWQYAAGGGRCVAGECETMAYGDIRHGITQALTVQLGLDDRRDSTMHGTQPYGAVSFLPAPGWTSSVQGRLHSYLRGSIQNFGTGSITGAGAIGINEPGEGGIALARETDAVIFVNGSLQVMHLIPALGQRSLTLSTRLERRQHGGGERWDVTGIVPIRSGVLEAGIQSNPLAAIDENADGGPMVRIAPTLSLARTRLRKIGIPTLRVEGGFQGVSLAQWDVALSVQAGRGSYDVAVRRLVGGAGTQAIVGGSVTLGVGRLLGRLTSRRGRTEGGYSANGAVAFGANRRITPLEYGGLGLSGIEGHVFRDVNGDGAFGPQDEPTPNVTVQIGGIRVRTDSSGHYSTWSAIPYEAVDVQLDSLSLDEPSWVPGVTVHWLRPPPQMYSRVDFPLVHVRELVGRVALAAGAEAGGGIAIQLRDAATGAMYETRTFSDGGFYLTRIRPGTYTLTVAEASLTALKAQLVAPVQVVVPSAGDEVLEIPPVVLAPVRP